MSITILDGGMGQELIARQGFATGLWSTQALLDAPHLVRAVHDAFFEAGAEVATVNSYGLLPDRLVPVGLEDRLESLVRLACETAVASRDAAGGGLVAGALGPIGFSYQPDMAPEAEQAAEIYAPLAAWQAEYVDVVVLETMASIEQVRGGLMGTAGCGKPVWCAVSVDDSDGTRLRSGEPVADLAAVIAEYTPAAVMVNCSKPEAVSTAVPLVAQFGLPVGAYANGFTGISSDFDSVGATVDLLEARRDLGPEAYANFAQGWARDGATIIGGCCEVGPDHIRVLAQRLKGAEV